MVFADGENLVFRYQELLKAGKKLNPNVIHIPDVFVWHPNIAAVHNWSVVRVNYYTSGVATDEKIAELEERISRVLVPRRSDVATQICPRVFKKESKSRKTKIVDISICIDALRHSYHGHVDAILLLSGDADYLPLVKEIMRNGTQVWVGALSDGLSLKIPPAVDRFIGLDQWFFLPEK
ncbi:MAG: NYN domain-containing protein [Chloroflexi bacterium]|nr:NYN domain-containing protein [Chloroflexota bacterium]